MDRVISCLTLVASMLFLVWMYLRTSDQGDHVVLIALLAAVIVLGIHSLQKAPKANT